MIKKFKTDGIKIKSTGFPKFNPDYVLHEVSLGRIFDKVTQKDFDIASKTLAEKLVADGVLTGTPTLKMGKDFIRDNKLTWHHFEEDLETLQLVPTAIHDLVKHSGGSSIAKDLSVVATSDAGIFTRFKNWAKSWL